MDTTYQNQLHELNELNWERFKAELHGESKSIRAEMSSLRAEVRAEISTLGSDLRREMEAGFAQLRLEMAALRTEMAQFQSSMMKWMFVYWTGTMAVVVYALFGR